MTDGETESIAVAEVSDGPCETGQPGQPVDLPVVEVLTGRGFVTGKSGSGKSNTASVISEKLLDNGFGLLVVDIDGEYYGLKEEYEILHAGADEECDIQVTVEHAEKLASLALEQNVPIILDVSSFLDESEARDLLTAVSKHLFAKGKKRKQPFLLLVEEVHEYIPENGSVGECGKMLIKIGKRGRKHGLGMVGISQRPADVKKDFITQCDWLVWHRLTWNNDTKVVRRIIDSEHSEAVEDLDDGEAFLMTDWAESVRRVQFQRKRTFDAGATPGLDDFERPELKSVSDNLVSELQDISEEEQARENRIAELREELDRKNSRIAELEGELADARDLERMARQFTDALVDHVEGTNPGRTEQQRMRERRARANESTSSTTEDGNRQETADESARDEDAFYATTAMTWPGEDDRTNGTGSAGSDGNERSDDSEKSGDGPEEDAFEFREFADVPAAGADAASSRSDAAETSTEGSDSEANEGSVDAVTRGFGAVGENPLGDRATDAFERGDMARQFDDSMEAGELARLLREEVANLDARTRQMLRYYRDHGPGTPTDALFSACGSEDRTEAYARNHRLRVRGLVEHVGRGRYAYRVPALLREHTGYQQVDPYVERVEDVLKAEGAPESRDSAQSAD